MAMEMVKPDVLFKNRVDVIFNMIFTWTHVPLNVQVKHALKYIFVILGIFKHFVENLDCRFKDFCVCFSQIFVVNLRWKAKKL